jgi:hypothetical protein
MAANNPNHLETRDIGAMPGISGKIAGSKKMESYVVKYYKADLNEPADMLELSQIETRALHAKPGDEEVVLIDKDKYTFMQNYYIVIKYLEKN